MLDERTWSTYDRLPAVRHGDDYLEGIALGLHFQGPSTYDGPLWEIAQVGADTVSLVVEWHQDDVHAVEIAPAGALDAQDHALRLAIRRAHSIGLEVMLFPILQLDEIQVGEWRGTLTPRDRAAWWTAYTRYIQHYAELAEEERVALFSVGSELGSMELDPQWGALIASVRGTYSGQLTYSANWDHFGVPTFWPELDYIGVTAYYELTTSPEERPSVGLMVRAWQPFLDGLATVSNREARPVLITEVGYASQPNAAYHPWDYTQVEAVDLALQRTLYEAALTAFESQPYIEGVFLWNWFGAGGSTDTGYTPRNKPAEQVVRHWYGGEESGE